MMARALPLACSLPSPLIPPYAVMSGNVAHTARCTRIVFATRPASTADPDAHAGYADDAAAAFDVTAFFVGAVVVSNALFTYPVCVPAVTCCQPPAESPTAVTCAPAAVSYTHLRAHETVLDLVCRL